MAHHDSTHNERDQFKNRKIAVIGAAKSGIAVAQLMKRHEAVVFVSEKEKAEKRPDETELLSSLNIECEFGQHSERILESDFVIISPGVPGNIPILKQVRQSNIPVYSELEVASWLLRSPLIAITGSNGKTTTTTLIGKIFEAARIQTIVAGNVGTPLSDHVDHSQPEGVAVVEVSSFQAEGFLNFRPKIGVLLNLSPDHMDRYQSVDDYYSAKKRVFENQRSDDYLVYNDDDTEVKRQIESLRARKIPFSVEHALSFGAYVHNESLYSRLNDVEEKIIDADAMGLRGRHNVYNTLAAILAAKLMNIPIPDIQKAVHEFQGVEHRLEFVAEIDGVRYYNDSKATNVDSAYYALESFRTEKIFWIAGGKHKGSPYMPLQELVRSKVRFMVLIGQAAPIIEKDLEGCAPVIKAKTLEDAVQQSHQLAKPGDVVVLSPACSSYDMFKNYEERGKLFKDAVHKLKQ
jgi:UDP-N-acetylmuramoylalanine--D-glutamate ligase